MTYLDHNATTPVALEVLEAMLPWFTEHPGNASSSHVAGRTAAAAVADARADIAEVVGCAPSELVFTSGATESDNLALRGVGGPVAVAATEHKAVLDTAASIAHSAVLPVDTEGRVSTCDVAAAGETVSLISVMVANNETGLVQDVADLAEAAHSNGALFHTDATAALGKIPLDIDSIGVDLASFSAHKLNGPKGVGALFVRRGTRISPSMTGGGHEAGRRSGTLNIPGIVGFAAAAKLTDVRGSQEPERQRRLTSKLLAGLGEVGGIQVFSDHMAGLPNTLFVRFIGADAEAVMAACPDVAMSTGSACTSAVPAPSHVLVAMGVPAKAGFETIRLSVGTVTTDDDVAVAIRQLVAAVRFARSHATSASMLSPLITDPAE